MVHPVGSTVTLTCMADLDPAIDVPVIVNIELSDPAGRILTATTPSVSGSTYSSMATISSFGRDQSGLYTSSATVSPSPLNSFLSGGGSQSQTLRVTTGMSSLELHTLIFTLTHTQVSTSPWGERSMLTTMSFPSLRLGLHPTLDFSASLTGCRVVQEPRLDSGIFLMGHMFQCKAMLPHCE